MGWFIRFIDSSVGKKLIMALTGIFLSLFLIAHLAGNLLLLKNDKGEAFGHYSEIMADPSNLPVRVIEIGLFILFIYHIVNGIRLAIANSKARGKGYKEVEPKENSSFFSRFMVQSGVLIFIFLVIHLRTFFFPHRVGTPTESMYQTVVDAFSSPIYSGFYIVALVMLAFHLIHGVQSAFQTFGLRHTKYTDFIKGFGYVFAILICIGFAIIPIYFLYRSMNGGY
jgi:succinate dehydrogenase / fumarate reductase, cytochrome b subunit